MLSEKKKSFDLGLHISLQNSWYPLKKKVFTLISSPISLFFPKIRVFSKKKKVFIQNRSINSEQTSAGIETVCAICEGGLRRLPHLPHPISTTVCGGNRLVSVQEIKESERKLKINSLLRLHSLSFTISVKKYLLEFLDPVRSTTLLKGDQNFIEEFPYNQVAFDETQLPVLLYVAGYAAKKVTSRLVMLANNCLLMKVVNFCRLTYAIPCLHIFKNLTEAN